MAGYERDGAPGLELTREPGCCGELAWRLDLSPDRDFPALARRLIERGYHGRCFTEVLMVLRHASGHEIVLVPKTGRVQLRVYRLTPREARPTAAQAMLDDLIAAFPPAAEPEGAPSAT